MLARASLASDTCRLDSELLLAHTLGVERSALYARSDLLLSGAQTKLFNRLLQRRIKGEPVAYILGYKHFWDMKLEVTPAVLIPRPETELLVEQALHLLQGREGEPLYIADLGTGSGAVALALARHSPAWRVTATDISRPALRVARRNARRMYSLRKDFSVIPASFVSKTGGIQNRQSAALALRLWRRFLFWILAFAGMTGFAGMTNFAGMGWALKFIRSDWCDKLPAARFDMIVSNPPYIAADDGVMQSPPLCYEPRQALAAGDEGLTALRAVIAGAVRCLKPGGWLLLEHGMTQAAAVAALLQHHGYHNITTYKDIAGLDRVTCARQETSIF